jgi:acyl-CoA thioester hydrolase
VAEEEWLTHRAVEHRLRVRYAETDQAGIVYHANFLVWFHEARDTAFRVWSAMALKEREANNTKWTDEFEDILARGRSIGSDSLEEIGYRFLVVEASCRYLSPARYGDEVIVTVIPCKTSVAKLTFAYKARNAKTQRPLAMGKTSSVIIDRTGRMLITMPVQYRDIFQSAEPVRVCVTS